MENEQRFLTAEKAKPGVKELADGILLTELTPGTGTKAGPDGKVQVLYVGRLPDGTVFDQNTQPQWFNLDSVIAGWRTRVAKHAGRREMATGDSIGSGLRRRRCRRFDRAVYTVGIRSGIARRDQLNRQ